MSGKPQQRAVTPSSESPAGLVPAGLTGVLGMMDIAPLSAAGRDRADMTTMLNKPAELSADHWSAIAAHADRLERARRDSDLNLVIGSAKDLVETIAKIVLELNGEVVPSNADLSALLTKTHIALDRQPGKGTAEEPTVRVMAQGAKTIVSQLPELRNRLGTGHGRVLTAQVDEELGLLALDAALLWARWALRRFGQVLAGRPLGLVTALQGATFYRGDLRSRLQALQLPTLDPPDQRLIGVEVAHRAMSGTWNVMDEGVDQCAQQPDLTIWPTGYRRGLLEGLFLNREGYVDVNAWGAKAAAAVIAPVASADSVLQELADKVGEAGWAYRFASDMALRYGVAGAMNEVLAVLPEPSARDAWQQIMQRFQSAP
jgi:hypothetical protein